METKRERRAPLHFPSVPLTELPDGHSKRREIVPDILEGLKELDEYALIKIDLAKLGAKKADLRAALHRAAKKEHLELSTASTEICTSFIGNRKRAPGSSAAWGSAVYDHRSADRQAP